MANNHLVPDLIDQSGEPTKIMHGDSLVYDPREECIRFFRGDPLIPLRITTRWESGVEQEFCSDHERFIAMISDATGLKAHQIRNDGRYPGGKIYLFIDEIDK